MKLLALLLLVCLIGMTAVPAAGDYMGGDIQLGGSGPYTLSVTETTTPVITQQMQPVAPVTVTGSLAITTTPAGAMVFIDGVQKGISPVTITGLAPGSHTLLLKMDGYQDLSAPVTITAGQTQTLNSALPQAPVAAGTSAPAPIKTPGFEAIPGIAALGALLLVKKISP